MKPRYTVLLAAISLFSATASHAQELWNHTAADTTASGDRQISVEINSDFLLTAERRLPVQERDIVATWQRAGGIDPTPFRILIPAGCFVSGREGLVVRGTSCGVQVYLGSEIVEVDAFSAVSVPPEPINPGDPLDIRIRLTLAADSARASEVLSTLGGAEVSLTIGRESGIAVPKSIDAFAGIEPTPF